MFYTMQPLPHKKHCNSFPKKRWKPNLRKLVIGSWNVEGFTDTKLEELQNHMLHNHIGMFCLQETHGGFLIQLSGDENGCFAGVGFIVAPNCRRVSSVFVLNLVAKLP